MTPGERLLLLDRLKGRESQETSLRIASVLGHLIGTPLNVIVGRAALIRSNPTGAEVERNAGKIEEQVTKVAERVRRLIEDLRPTDAYPEARAMSDLLADALALYGPIAESRGVQLTLEDDDLSGLFVADGGAVLVVLSSLLSMALKAAKPSLCVSIRCDTSQEAGLLEIDVPGLEPPQGRIDSMEPQYEPDPERASLLQVLSVCHGMASSIGGKLEIKLKEPGTTRILFRCGAGPGTPLLP